MHDIAVLNDIFFSLDTHLSGFFYSRFRTVGNIILIFDDFGADKAFFKVPVWIHNRRIAGLSILYGKSRHDIRRDRRSGMFAGSGVCKRT